MSFRGRQVIYKSEDYSIFLKKARVCALAAAQASNWKMPHSKCRVKVFIHAFRRRRADADNIMKPVLDSLTGIFFEDDLYAVPMMFFDKDDWITVQGDDEKTLVAVELLDQVAVQESLALTGARKRRNKHVSAETF